jgi:polygalacturonase
MSRGANAQTIASNPTRGVFDVTAFGARGDGKSLDTAAINQAITAAAAEV